MPKSGRALVWHQVGHGPKRLRPHSRIVGRPTKINQLVDARAEPKRQQVFVHYYHDCPVHPVESKRLQIVVYRRVRFGDQEMGAWVVTAPTAVEARRWVAGINRPPAPLGKGQSNWHGPGGGSFRRDRRTRPAARDAPDHCSIGADCLSGITRPQAIFRQVGTRLKPSACGRTRSEPGLATSEPLPRREPSSTRSTGPKSS